MKPYFLIFTVAIVSSLFFFRDKSNTMRPWYESEAETLEYKAYERKYCISEDGEWKPWNKWERYNVSFSINFNDSTMTVFHKDFKNVCRLLLDTEDNFFDGASHFKCKFISEDGIKGTLDLVQFNEGIEMISISFYDIRYVYSIRKNYERMLYMRLQDCLEQ